MPIARQLKHDFTPTRYMACPNSQLDFKACEVFLP